MNENHKKLSHLHNILSYFSENNELRQKLALLQKTCRRQLEKIVSLQQFKRRAKSKQFKSDQVKEVLKRSFSMTQAQVLIHNKKQARKWSEEDISEGLVLRSFSRRAYTFLREKKKLPFPSESTLQSWVKNFKCGPGMQIDSTNILKSKILAEDSSLIKLGVIAFDEMEVAKSYEFDQGSEEIIGPHKKVQVLY